MSRKSVYPTYPSTMTTVGYGDVVPVSPQGRILAIGLVMLGSLAYVFYTAIFATALLSPELAKVRTRLHIVSREVQDIEEEVRVDEIQLSELKELIQKALGSIETLKSNRPDSKTSTSTKTRLRQV